jgi:Uma2 family endonuclease
MKAAYRKTGPGLRALLPIFAELWDGSSLYIPSTAGTFEGFRKWAHSDDYPERGRVSFINHKIFIEMSQEELETHNKVKTAIGAGLYFVNEEIDLGELFVDGALLANPAAELLTIADGTFLKWETLESGRAHLVPRRGHPQEIVEVHGSPDWVLEIVSKSSVIKDTVELRLAYHRAEIPEFWLVDARGSEIAFQVLVRRRTKYVPVPARDGWHYSPVFGRSFRLVRRVNRQNRWTYKLEMKAGGALP